MNRPELSAYEREAIDAICSGGRIDWGSDEPYDYHDTNRYDDEATPSGLPPVEEQPYIYRDSVPSPLEGAQLGTYYAAGEGAGRVELYVGCAEGEGAYLSIGGVDVDFEWSMVPALLAVLQHASALRELAQ